MKKNYLGMVCAVSSAIYGGIALSQTQQTTIADQQQLAVTIYNENLALVKDRRRVELAVGESRLAFRDVSARLRAETALLRGLTEPSSLTVIEQNFDYDLLSPAKLLEKYVGKNVQLAQINPVTGVEALTIAKVLSVQQGVVVEIAGQIESNPPGRYLFPAVPDNLIDRPTLSVQLNNQQQGKQSVELSYLTGGLSWKADYVAELSADDQTMSLLGWVTLNNQSGTRYNNARLQLVAGDLNQVSRSVPRRYKTMALEAQMVADQPMSQQSLLDYHLYTLTRPTTLANNQSKQVKLLGGQSIPVSKSYHLDGQSYFYHSRRDRPEKALKITTRISFKNNKTSGLGVPLPKGIIRVYKQDNEGDAQFVGEDNIDHTAIKKTVSLTLGKSFDITASKVQTDYKKVVVSKKQYNFAAEVGMKITLDNGKPQPVKVVITEPLQGDWKMLKESSPHQKISAGRASWTITVPAMGSAELVYRVLIRH